MSAETVQPRVLGLPKENLDLVLFRDIVRRINGDVPNDQVESLHEFVRSQKNDDELIATSLKVPKLTIPDVEPKAATTFRNWTGAVCSIVQLLVYSQVQVKAEALRKISDSKFFGFCTGLPAGALL